MEQVKSEEEMGGAMGGASRGEGAELLGSEEKYPAGDGVGVSVVEEGWGEQPLQLVNPARQLSSSVQSLSGEIEIETVLGRGAGPLSSTPPNSSCRIASRDEGSGFIAMATAAGCPGMGLGLATVEFGKERGLVAMLPLLFGLE